MRGTRSGCAMPVCLQPVHNKGPGLRRGLERAMNLLMQHGFNRPFCLNREIPQCGEFQEEISNDGNLSS